MELDSLIQEHLGKLQLFSATPHAAEASVNEFVEACETWAAGFCNSNCNASWSRRKPSIAGLDNGGGNGITPHWGPSSSPDGCMTRMGTVWVSKR